MVDKNNNIKTPESSRGAPSSAPFFAAFPFPPSDLPRPSTMPPRALGNNSFYRTVENPHSSPSFVNSSREQCPSYRNPYSLLPEEESHEQAPVYNTFSARRSFLDLASSLSVQRTDSIPPSSLPSCPEASRAAPPTTPANSRKYKSMIIREDGERAAQLRGIRDLHNFDRLIPRQDQEKKRSLSLPNTDESDSVYLYPDTESESESEFFEEEERKSSPVPDCSDESDGDYTDPDPGSESDTDSESGSEHEPETSQDEGKEMSLSVGEELRTLSPPGFAWARSSIPSWNDLGPRDDDMLYNDLYGLVPAPPLSPYLPPTAPCTPPPPSQEPEEIQSSSPVDDDSLSTLGQAIGKASRSLHGDSLSTLNQAFEKALEKQQREDLASVQPSLSQDLEKNMLSSLSAYDLNIEKLGKEISNRCDSICERFDRLEKEKPDTELAILRNIEEMAEIMFPGRKMWQLTSDERIGIVRVERRHRVAQRYQKLFGISGNAIAGPSKEQEKKTFLGPKLDEMIRQEREKLCDLEGDTNRAVDRVQDFHRARRVAADAAACRASPDPRPRLPSPKPNNAAGMSLEETGEEIDARLAESYAEEDKDAFPDYETDMELEDALVEGQDPLPASPSSSQGQKRKRVTASDHVKSIFEHFEAMRKHVQEGVEREMKRRKDGPSFEECMNELYPADSEIWKIDDEPIQVRSSKHKGLPSDEDLGNDDISAEEYLWDEKELRGSEDYINGLSNEALPVIPPFPTASSMPPFPTTPLMPLMPALPPFPIIPAMPSGSLFDVGSKRYPITRPASLTVAQSTPRYWAMPLGFSRDHRPWRPWIEILEAVSYKPFSDWDDITGVREFIHGELSRVGWPKVTIEACRVKGEENVRLMVFVPMRGNGCDLSLPVYDFSHSLSRILNRLSLWGINDVKVEIWETDFDLMVVSENIPLS